MLCTHREILVFGFLLLTMETCLINSGKVVWGQETRTWNNTNTGWGGSGTPAPWFDVASNWAAGIAPGPLDTAYFNSPTIFEVWWDGYTQSQIPQIGNLRFDSGAVLFRNVDVGIQHTLTLRDTGPMALHLSSVNPSGLSLWGMHLNSLGGAYIDTGSGLTVGNEFLLSHPAGTVLTVAGELNVRGYIDVVGGSVVNSHGGVVIDGGLATISRISSYGQWNDSNQITVGESSAGHLRVEGTLTGHQLTAGGYNGSFGQVDVNGPVAQAHFSGGITVGELGAGVLNINSGGKVSTAGNLRIGVDSFVSSQVLVHGLGSELTVGSMINTGPIGGTLDIQAGGQVHSAGSSFQGSVTVQGAGSQWNSGSIDAMFSNFNVHSGGHLNADSMFLTRSSVYVHNGGTISSTEVSATDLSTISVSGLNSKWHNSGFLYIDQFDSIPIDLFISSAGVLETNGMSLSVSPLNSGTINVLGFGSKLVTNGNLSLGSSGGTVNTSISDNGLVSVASGFITEIGAHSSVNLYNGRFEFSRTSMESWEKIGGTGGSLAGNVLHQGNTHVSTLTSFQSSIFDISQVNIENGGTLYGDGSFIVGLHNRAEGEVETRLGERMRFAGPSNHNFGEINNFNGQIRFDGAMHNHGFIAGRGEFVANGGWQNHGVMAFSSGNADVLGDVEMTAGSRIVITGGATTTFFDDIIHNGIEIRTSTNSHSVFLGSVTGAGNFTGSGTVYFEGDLRPGNSPNVVSFGGDLVFGAFSTLHVELGGLALGDYDQLQIAGDLWLDGDLVVSLIDGHSLNAGDWYLVADIDGLRSGFWNGLGEGALLGNFGGRDLFITYGANGGTGIALFTAIPEPSSLLLLATCFAVVGGTRRRR